jgi:hypothetical protein
MSLHLSKLVSRTWWRQSTSYTRIAVVLVILLAVSAVSVRAWRTAGNAAISKLNIATHQPITTQTPVPVTAFVVPGLRVALNAAQVSSNSGSPLVNCAITNNGGEDLEDLELLLLDFTANGKIDSIVGRKFSGSLTPRVARTLTFTTDRPVPANHSLLLTVRAARGQGTAQEINTLELLQGLMAFRSNGIPPGLAVREIARQQVRVDPNFCHTVFRIAHRLTNVPVAGYTCSQGEESFFIAYRN